MAKDNRKIMSVVRVQVKHGSINVNQDFSAGQEDELASVLTEKDGARLLESGTLVGDWEFTGGPNEPAAPSTPPQVDADALKARIAELEAQLAAQTAPTVVVPEAPAEAPAPVKVEATKAPEAPAKPGK